MSIYMQISSIPGSVSTDGFNQQIQLESLDFDISRDIHTRVGNTSSREGSLAQVGRFTVKKYIDVASLLLLKAAISGKPIATITVSFTTNSETAPQTYLSYTLSNVIIAAYEVDENRLDKPSNPPATLPNKPIETLTLDFTELDATYIDHDAGDNPGAPSRLSWDVSQGTVG
jgi:type VI secretion system secreted protein Hcp